MSKNQLAYDPAAQRKDDNYDLTIAVLRDLLIVPTIENQIQYS